MKKEIAKSLLSLKTAIKKHSPEILVVAGVIGVVTSAVMACKATTKVGEILDKTKEDIEAIHKCEEDESVKDQYSSEDAKKDLAIVYVQTGVKFAKLYGPSVVLGALSITSILASNNILRKRNVALGAAYAAIDKGFKEYRSRVIERFGEEVDRELKYNLKAKKFDETVIDEETGKEKKVKKNGFVVSPADISGYARFFEKYTQDEDGNSILNPHWESNNEYNLMFIKAQERYANDLLKAKKRVFLNEVYEMLGLPRTKAGQIVGWVYDPENPYANRDSRFYQTLIYNGSEWEGKTVRFDINQPNANSARCGYGLKKFIEEHVGPDSDLYTGVYAQDNDWPYFRYAEIQLNYAEAMNEALDAPDDNVYDAVNDVRTRSGQPSLPDGLTKDEMRERIRNERRVELVLEEHRFFDLRRWKDAAHLRETVRGMTVQYDETEDKFIYTIVDIEPRSFSETYYYLPIPQSEVEKNPLLNS